MSLDCTDVILARADQARVLLAEARDAKSAKRVSDMAHAVEIYAKRQHASQDCIDYAHGVKVDAMTLLGEFLAAAEKNTGARGIGTSAVPKGNHTPRTLLEDGIDKKESAISQRLFKVSREEPEKHALIREAKAPITSVYSSAHVSHNSGNNEWYTPEEYIIAARKVLGSIDLDPASSSAANEVIKATRFYSKEDDGLTKAWRGKVWMNPPYASELISLFTHKLVEHFRTKDITSAIVLVNNSTETKWFQELANRSRCICFPSSRIRFWHPSKFTAAPLQGQAIFGLGVSTPDFIRVFIQFGVCCRVL